MLVKTLDKNEITINKDDYKRVGFGLDEDGSHYVHFETGLNSVLHLTVEYNEMIRVMKLYINGLEEWQTH